MAETNNGNGEDKPKVDPQKQYLIEQFGNLMEKVGEGYGEIGRASCRERV